MDTKRGSVLFIGGDLAYPSPTPDIYEERLFRPFEQAMMPPDTYDPQTVATGKASASGILLSLLVLLE